MSQSSAFFYGFFYEKSMVMNITEDSVRTYLTEAKGKKVAIIGDVMIDRYFWGKVTRVSPEAPVPVVDIEDETMHLGGAANVGFNLFSLGLTPILCGVIGNDNTGRRMIELCENAGIMPDALIVDTQRPTTVKTRVIGNNQQITRLDRESREKISIDIMEEIIRRISQHSDISAIIFEDYNKGVIAPELIHRVHEYASQHSIPVFVDPKKSFFFDYQGVYCFKPNRKEAQDALGFALDSAEAVEKAGKELLLRLQCENVLITLGEAGMRLFEKNGRVSSVATRARHVADVSGAGDTVIATLTAMVTGGASIQEAAAIANYAAGVVCEEPGIVSITPSQLVQAIIRMSDQ
ncbi:MAG: D-glycero-beta-D-manno-heptose-7-phosphate kinase [Candidatus Kapabacteria bacterium]|jgi:rfaE bifunctional protein kinase chain/domain|nr:D-glycero-beta-D-manno-heptose-7-phosphate kinase [Candidatus Kapabacteria bacterium]